MSEGSWYYSQNHERQGPVSFDQLQELARSGDLQPTDLVWTESMSDWVPAQQVESLAVALERTVAVESAAPPLPPPTDVTQSLGEVEATTEPSSSDDTLLHVRHGFATLCVGLFLDWLILHPLLVPSEADAGTATRILLAGIAFLLSIAVVVLPVGRLIRGRWPFEEHFTRVFGSPTSHRRHLILAVGGGLLAYLLLFAPSAESGSILQSGQAFGMASVHLLGSMILAYFLAGFALHGEFPLAAQARGLIGQLPPQLLTPSQKHLLISLGIGFGLGFGSWLLEVFRQLNVADDLGTIGDPRIGIWRTVFWTLVAYFPVGYWVNGEWPFGRLIVALLGGERTFRRRFLLSAIFTVPFYWWTFRDLPPDQMTFGNFTPVLIFFAAVYYLLGYSVYWEATGNHLHKVLPDLAELAPPVRETICQQVDTHGLETDQKMVRISEKGIYPVPFDFDVVHSEQLQITYNQARVILRVLPFGKDLYLRWESFLDLSGRRLWLVGGLLFRFIDGVFRRVSDSPATYYLERAWNIVLPGGEDTTGAELRQSQLIGEKIRVPSYMFDDLYVLEDIVTGSASQILDELILASGRQDKVQLSIERNTGQPRQAF